MLYFIKAERRLIEEKPYYKVSLLDVENVQIFNFYVKETEKSINFAKNTKVLEDVTNKLVFVIKRNNKISFDIK